MHSLTGRINLHLGDITELNVDAVVTAANEALCGGGGVDGAVHDAAGAELLRASMALAPCPTGESRITDSFKLPGRYVIHTVGPVYRNLESDAARLAAAYASALALANSHQVTSVALPCISTGVFGFPPAPACEIAFKTTCDFLSKNGFPGTVVFCCYEASDFALYQQRFEDIGLLNE